MNRSLRLVLTGARTRKLIPISGALATGRTRAPPCPLPARLVDCVPIPLKIGDPLEGAAREGRLCELTLLVRLTDILDEESIEVRINGVPVSVRPAGKEEGQRNVMGVMTSIGGTWFEGKVGAPPLRRGVNTVRVLPSTGCWVKDTTAVEEALLGRSI